MSLTTNLPNLVPIAQLEQLLHFFPRHGTYHYREVVKTLVLNQTLTQNTALYIEDLKNHFPIGSYTKN